MVHFLHYFVTCSYIFIYIYECKNQNNMNITEHIMVIKTCMSSCKIRETQRGRCRGERERGTINHITFNEK